MNYYKLNINKDLIKKVLRINLLSMTNKIKKSILNLKINYINFKMFTKTHPLYKISCNNPNILRKVYFDNIDKFNYKDYVVDEVIYGDYKEPDTLEKYTELKPVIYEINEIKNNIDIINDITFKLKKEKKNIKRKILTIKKR